MHSKKSKRKRKRKINWTKCNKKLVQRGANAANLLDELMKMKGEWNEELKKMNEGKRGSPFSHPDSLIIILAILKLLTSKGYRFIEGFSYLFLPVAPTYSAIQKRVFKFDIEILKGMNKDVLGKLGNEKIVHIIKDGTGIQINGRYVWIDKRFNLKRKRKWKKLDITIDMNTLAILSLKVLDESANEGEAKEFEETMKEAKGNLPEGTKIGKSYGDGGFDSNPNFEYCERNGIEPVIRIRKPTRKKVERRRNIKKAMLLHKKYLPDKRTIRDKYAEEQIDWDRFVKRKKYGKRSGIEGFNGSFKRFYGERAHSRLGRSIQNEFLFKTFLWNKTVLG